MSLLSVSKRKVIFLPIKNKSIINLVQDQDLSGPNFNRPFTLENTFYAEFSMTERSVPIPGNITSSKTLLIKTQSFALHSSPSSSIK